MEKEKFQDLILDSALLNIKEAKPIPEDVWARCLDNALEKENVIPFIVKRYGALAVAASLLIAFGLFFFLLPSEKRADVASRVAPAEKGETALKLNGHSAVLLETGSDLRVQRNAEDRVVLEMTAGRALFSVDKGVFREFKVMTPFGDAVVMGTVFSVSISGERAFLNVLEGTVLWQAADGKSMEISAAGSLETVSGAHKRGPLSAGTREEMERGLKALRALPAEERKESRPSVKPALRPTGRPARENENADEAEAMLGKADALKAKGKYDQAILAYRKVVIAWPQTHAGQAALFETGNIRFSRLRDMNGAGRDLREYLSSYPKGEWREEALTLLIEISFKNSAYRESAELIEKSLAEFPHSGKAPDLLYKLATLYRAETREPAKAAKAYQDFLRLFPDDYRAEDARYWLKEISAAR